MCLHMNVLGLPDDSSYIRRENVPETKLHASQVLQEELMNL